MNCVECTEVYGKICPCDIYGGLCPEDDEEFVEKLIEKVRKGEVVL